VLARPALRSVDGEPLSRKMLDWTARLVILMLIDQMRLALYCMNGDGLELDLGGLLSALLFPLVFCIVPFCLLPLP
jgi:hypothetical protein